MRIVERSGEWNWEQPRTSFLLGKLVSVEVERRVERVLNRYPLG